MAMTDEEREAVAWLFMMACDLSDEEWDAIPREVQDKLLFFYKEI